MKSNAKLIGYLNVGTLGSDLVCRVLANDEQKPPTRGRLKKLKANDNETMSKHKGRNCAVRRSDPVVGGGVCQRGAELCPAKNFRFHELELDVEFRNDRQAGCAGKVEPVVGAIERPNLIGSDGTGARRQS